MGSRLKVWCRNTLGGHFIPFFSQVSNGAETVTDVLVDEFGETVGW